jgi:hypothetical protein
MESEQPETIITNGHSAASIDGENHQPSGDEPTSDQVIMHSDFQQSMSYTDAFRLSPFILDD